MCGRFTNRLTWPEIVKLYRLPLDLPARNTQARYNICPTDPVDVVIERDGKRDCISMRWGLVPFFWSKTLKELNKLATFNARAETVTTKPFFREPFESAACLIPASGYYEWHDTPGGKQPSYFTRADGDPVTIAGLRDRWHDKSPGGETIVSCTMVITEPNDFVRPLHDRMPVILEPDQFDGWLAARPAPRCSSRRPTTCCGGGQCRGG